MTETEVVDLLRRKVSEGGTVKAFAEANHMSVPYLSDVLNGNRGPAGKILDALGLERVVTYRKKVPA